MLGGHGYVGNTNTAKLEGEIARERARQRQRQGQQQQERLGGTVDSRHPKLSVSQA